ncbi:MAG: hypothetical protein QXE99_05270 [Acidilobaceae archaeon]
MFRLLYVFRIEIGIERVSEKLYKTREFTKTLKIILIPVSRI